MADRTKNVSPLLIATEKFYEHPADSVQREVEQKELPVKTSSVSYIQQKDHYQENITSLIELRWMEGLALRVRIAGRMGVYDTEYRVGWLTIATTCKKAAYPSKHVNEAGSYGHHV